MAFNRFYLPTKYQSRAQVVSLGITCVFVSYQKNDKDAAMKVADYLLNAGIDVYFDQYDAELKSQNQSANPKEVTKAICNGINNSSHMIVVMSPSTKDSAWVPFEIGYGFDKTELRALCLRGIPKGSLPAYIRTVPILRDIYDLNGFVSGLVKQPKELLLKSQLVKEYADLTNPLSDVMDSLVNE
jgi:hypothetical protein